MILGMFLALVATTLLPVLFMAALIVSAQEHPRPLHETMLDIARPVGHQLGRVVDQVREIARSR